MRIIIGNKAVHIRESGNTLWYPRREQAVMAKLDTMYERTNPTELMWDKTKPKMDDVEKHINPDVLAVDPFRTKAEKETKKEKAKELDFPEESK